MKYLIPTTLLFLSVLAFGQGKDGKNTCTDALPPSADNLKNLGMQLPLTKHFCYSDHGGNYVLYLTEKQDKVFAANKLSSAIEAHLFQVQNDKSLTKVLSIRDKAGNNEAGLEFWSKLTEIIDIDKDGSIDPILVYRFYNAGDDGKVNYDAFAGRIKIILFYKGEKVVIRAITGDLDGERLTTATENFFSLPASVQKHLVKKMIGMYKDNLYGFDNSYKYFPQKPKGN